MLARTRSLLSSCIGCLLLLAAPAALADSADRVTVLRPPVDSCIESPAAAPTLPAGVPAPYAAVIRTELTFRSAGQPPDVEVFFREGDDRLMQAVIAHVSAYRWKCDLPANGLPVSKEFQFIRNDRKERVLVGKTLRLDTAPLDSACTAQILALPPPDWRARMTGGPSVDDPTDGTVLVHLTFNAPDQPPAVKLLYNSGGGTLARFVGRNVERYRTPCARPGAPVVMTQLYLFYVQWQASPQLKPELALTDLIHLAPPVRRQSFRFDFRTMACPFKVEFSPLQPHAANTAKEVGEPDRNRREFLEWLRDLPLEIPPDTMKTVAGRASVVTVPCAVLDFS